MNHICRVHVHEAPQQLVHEVLDVLVAEVLSGVDHPVQVCFHQVCDDVDVLVARAARGPLHVHQTYDVLVVEKSEQLDLTEDTLRVDQVLEGLWHLFYRHLRVGLAVIRTYYHTVGTVADLFDELVGIVYCEGCTGYLEGNLAG